jgi:predicted nucleic acid-binding Zn ribbon protein
MLYNNHDMPIYVYEHTGKHGKKCKKEVEVHQDFGRERLEKCPVCKNKGRRIIVSAHFTIDHLGHLDLQAQGFTKYTRRDKGTYEVEGAGRK